MKIKILSGLLTIIFSFCSLGLISHAVPVQYPSTPDEIWKEYTGYPGGLEVGQIGDGASVPVSVGMSTASATGYNYDIDVEWGTMKFSFTNSVRSWDSENHKYIGSATGGSWSSPDVDPDATEPLPDGIIKNNEIQITNKSAFAIGTSITYVPSEENPINIEEDSSNVVPTFRLSESGAIEASKNTTYTFDKDATTTNKNSVNVPISDDGLAPYPLIGDNPYYENGDHQMGSVSPKPQTVLFFPTSDAYVGDKDQEYAAGWRTAPIFFAFAGTPDPGFGSKGPIAGTIEINFYPYIGADLNNMSPNDDGDDGERGGTATPILQSNGSWQ